MAQWTSAYIDSLPDSSFLYIEAGGKKDGDGKTTPRALRHFPVKDANGKVDVAHVRNALARIPQSNVSASAKSAATSKAQSMLKAAGGDPGMGRSEETDVPPRDDLIRAAPALELIRSKESDMPILHGSFAVYGEWAEIRSAVEGHFYERFAPRAFRKTMSESASRIRCLFHHGQDPSVGYKVLGPITSLREEGNEAVYDVQMLDTDYNRALLPGLEAGQYGSSMRFGIVRKEDNRRPGRSDRNPDRILERTINEAYLRELGPTPLPAYAGTTAGVRSLTDEFVLGRFPTEALLQRLASPETPTRADIEAVSLLTQMYQLGQMFIDCEDDPDDGPDKDAMNVILNSLGGLIGTEAAEDEEGEPAEPDGMASEAVDSTEDPAPSPEAALVGTSRRSAAKTKSDGLFGQDRDREVPAWRL